jgi:hypothetical protein
MWKHITQGKEPLLEDTHSIMKSGSSSLMISGRISMENDLPVKSYDMDKVHDLRAHYTATMIFIGKELSPVNLDSKASILEFCNNELDIHPDNIQIKHLDTFLQQFDHDSTQFNAFYGVLSYLKLKYSIKNYIDCIIRHEVGGIVTLRIMDGEVRMPNRQPLSGNPEINQCERGEADHGN